MTEEDATKSRKRCGSITFTEKLYASCKTSVSTCSGDRGEYCSRCDRSRKSFFVWKGIDQSSRIRYHISRVHDKRIRGHIFGAASSTGEYAKRCDVCRDIQLTRRTRRIQICSEVARRSRKILRCTHRQCERCIPGCVQKRHQCFE